MTNINLDALLRFTSPALTAAMAGAGVVFAVMLILAVRRLSAVKLAVAVAVAIGIGTSVEGMYNLAVGPLKLHGVWLLIPAVLFESAAIATGARAQAHAKQHGHPGRYAGTVWAFAFAAGVVTSLNGHSVAECAFRLVAPLIGTAVWYQSLSGGGKAPDAITWVLTPRRLLVRIGLAQPGETDVISVHREQRINALTVRAHQFHHGALLPKRWVRWRLRQLALAADDGMVAAAQDRVARVHRIEALTAPVRDTGADTPPSVAAAIAAVIDPATVADMSADTAAVMARTDGRTPRKVSTATLAARILAKRPDITSVELAAKLDVSERTARRYLPKAEAPINGHDHNLTTAPN